MKTKQELYEYHKEYRRKNKLKIFKQRQKYREENKEKISLKNKIYGITHKEHVKKYREKNKIYIAERARNYYLDNKKHLDILRNRYAKNKRKENINFKITCNLRIRIYDVLNGRNKSKRTLELLGCSIEFLKNHLEKSFKAGMSWENYGRDGWTIDHI